MVAKYVAGLRALLARRIVTIVAAAFVLASIVIILVRLGPPARLPDVKLPDIDMPKLPNIPGFSGLHPTHYERCEPGNHTEPLKQWKEAREKYDDLMGDKFTIAIQTYKRPKELDDTLRVLLSEKIPSLLEIVVVWNNLDETPPGNFKSEKGVPVRFRVSARNSLNQKLLPDPDFKTKAILLSDDDVYYKPQDLEFAFQTWRKFGQYRLTGALPRCATPDAQGVWGYNFCSKDDKEDVYSMIITNLCFSHMSFLDYYSSNNTVMQKVREYVDDHFNCEDIALNFVTSYLTGTGPLLVNGRDRYVNYEPAQGISKKPGHLEARSKCLNDLTEMFGCMPLVNETAHIERGVIVL
ncbi:glycosyltransferase family 64 protein [Trichoderma cornu-damae]|uniref:Glycosyltransferase family 64 protein n=1 Tax=Trichoderma cornu-damae TaxID=654480 RepID=A0A9P8QMR4_9HYPO|nr:glycosyltransferase family 64 protein [Trichoderma cornu-damae]